MKHQHDLYYQYFSFGFARGLALLIFRAVAPAATFAGSKQFIDGEINNDDTITLPVYEGHIEILSYCNHDRTSLNNSNLKL